MKYSHICLEEREQIFALINQDKSVREIGKFLRRSHSTISREINRCGGRVNYSPSKAEKHAERQNGTKGRKRLVDSKPEVLMESFRRLFENFSPEQISLSIERDFLEDPWMRISHETIYR